ncbi:hypothetical protein BE15_30665 [Sorangium cellulosum]|uniref:Uncharacterized protein n=1 Tax=Sorangium cellulosum TaxID=56 RepID=A0A150QSC0_SORCE|nr:hypothetical protein BE15_30665 [Sorangium cellulosum]
MGQGAQVVPLQVVLQVLKGTYIDPSKGTSGQETPLPPHRWEVQQVKTPTVLVRSTLSDTAGLSKIVKAPELTAAKADETWFLSLRPELTDAEVATVRSVGEVWIDLDKNQWVVLDSFPEIEKRKLLRIPLWTSRWKARLGGFQVSLGKDFAKEGTLRTDELTSPTGTLTSPWAIQVDFGWLRTYVRFQYYDVKQKKTLFVPPGVCLQALGSKLHPTKLTAARGRVGGGTRIDDDGTIFVLHERTMEGSADVDLGFDNRFLQETVVDLAASTDAKSAADARLVRRFPGPSEPEAFYLLPNAWSSIGMEARIGTGARAKWTALRPTPKGAAKPVTLDTDKTKQLIFHLDDIVLTDHTAGPVTIRKEARITIFDRRLRFRGPFDAVMVPLWASKLAENYCRAEEVFCTDGNTWKDLAFVINHEADFFVLREGRVTGTLGTTRFLGARKAEARAPENPIGNFLNGYPHLDNEGTVELHLFPDAYPGPYTAADEGKFLEDHPKAKLCHLLVYVPLKVVKDPIDPVTSMQPVFQMLLDAAERWDAAHPSSGASGKKDYVVIPEGGVKDNTRVVKLRHFYGNRTDGKHKFTINAAKTNKIDGKPFNRSFVQGKTMSLILAGAGPVPNSMGEDAGDKIGLMRFTLAHELGHVMGLPDEYAEDIDLEKLNVEQLKSDPHVDPSVPRFGQRDPAYPFYGDLHGMQQTNRLPRQRYNWHHIAFLNDGAKAQLPEGPYVGAYPTFRGGATHKMAGGNKDHPWKPVAQGKTKNGRATVVLYATGDDEATVERMFPRPEDNKKEPGEWMNGIAVVRTKLWFNFVASTAGDFADHVARWTILRDRFYARMFNAEVKSRQRFFLDGPPKARLPRIAVVFQPLIEYGPLPNPKQGYSPPNVTEADADVVVNVVFQSGTGAPAPPKKAPKTGANRLTIDSSAVGLSILRFVLGVAPTPPATVPSNAAITTVDLDQVVRKVEELMNCGKGTYDVKAMP